MTRDPITCVPEDPITTADERMGSADVGALLVVDGEEGALVGIVAQADLAIRVHDRGLVAEFLEEISEPMEAAASR
ncbi:MAG TPA: CBS domain-containing protein [Gemmatimonadota bacterium]|nr:CBS domain-containing protein [Gemmatimonadota bacterium]